MMAIPTAIGAGVGAVTGAFSDNPDDIWRNALGGAGIGALGGAGLGAMGIGGAATGANAASGVGSMITPVGQAAAPMAQASSMGGAASGPLGFSPLTMPPPVTFNAAAPESIGSIIGSGMKTAGNIGTLGLTGMNVYNSLSPQQRQAPMMPMHNFIKYR